jgi:hypothetical protein
MAVLLAIWYLIIPIIAVKNGDTEKQVSNGTINKVQDVNRLILSTPVNMSSKPISDSAKHVRLTLAIVYRIIFM